MEGIEPGSIGGLDCCCCPYVRLDCCEEMLLPWCLEIMFRGLSFNLVFSDSIIPEEQGWVSHLVSRPGPHVNPDCDEDEERFDFSVLMQCLCVDDGLLPAEDPCFDGEQCAWLMAFDLPGNCSVCLPVDTANLTTCEDLNLTFSIPYDCELYGGEVITVRRNRLRHCCCCCSLGDQCLVMELPDLGDGDCGASAAGRYALEGATEILFNGPGAGSGARHFGSNCRYNSSSLSFACEDYQNPLIECTDTEPPDPADHLLLTWYAEFSPAGGGGCKLTVFAVIQETECPVIGVPEPCDFIAASYSVDISGRNCNGFGWPLTLTGGGTAGTDYVVFPDEIIMGVTECGAMAMAAPRQKPKRAPVLHYKCSNCGYIVRSAQDLIGAVCPKCGK